MPLNRDFLGRTASSAEPFEVTRGDIRRFATAIGDANPAYHDVGAAKALGHPDLVAPPTFLISMGFSTAESLVMDPELGLDYSLVVHGEQSFRYVSPCHTGDTLMFETTVEDVYERRGGSLEFLVKHTSVTAADGRHVADLGSTIVQRPPDLPGLEDHA